MNLRSRLQKLERRLGPACDYPTLVCLDLPDGQPDMIALNGQWQSVPDGRACCGSLRDYRSQ